MPPRWKQAHADAVARGAPGYIDPDTGLYVMTSRPPAERGHCCGNGCRHCPYLPRHGGSGSRLPGPDRT